MKRIQIGLLGCNVRGQELIRDFMRLGCEVVAVCDVREVTKKEILGIVGKDCPWYNDFNAFVAHDMDAVILANYFHEHAPYAIRCLERGIHVYSECISNGTMAEGVALIRAAEKSKALYMLGENYPQMIFNREMQRICKGGTLGKILYAEGEYNHPIDPYEKQFAKDYRYAVNHWRNYFPRTYYITHSLGPIMRATGAIPKKVTAFTAAAPIDKNAPVIARTSDATAVIITQNDDGSLYRVTGCSAYGGHHVSYRICGTNGQVENLRGMGNQIMLRYNPWSKPVGSSAEKLYEPRWNDADGNLIRSSQHGGSDYLTARMFVDCVRSGKQPEAPFDVHSAVTMSSVAILAHRSVLAGGQVFEVPDFHLEESRKQYEDDTLSPFLRDDGGSPTLPSGRVVYEPSEEQVKKYLDLLK